MKRDLYQTLLAWKISSKRKPLILQGARQVGKTWLINQFAKNEYKHYVYLNFELQPELMQLFSGDLSPNKLIENLGFYMSKKINSQDTLLCFDEIQICPRALTSLKYFQEKAPQIHLIAAGSLLGVSIGKQSSFPVGKVNFLTLYPLSLREYLNASGEELLVNQISQQISNLPDIIHEKLLFHLKRYLFLGGMPEVVSEYLENKNISEVRKIQRDILSSFQNDFSKYTNPANAIKLSEVWNSIPYQLAKENKKFKYSEVKKKARASTYEQTIEWLKRAGLIHVVSNVRTAKIPISGYADYSKFKIFMLDTGLLGAKLDLSAAMILHPNNLFKEYNGAFLENYVCLELIKCLKKPLFYWNSERIAEVDFLFQWEKEIIPLEVKSGTNKNTKSLRIYANKFKPKRLMRTSPRNYTSSEDFENIPLYALFGLEKIYGK